MTIALTRQVFVLFLMMALGFLLVKVKIVRSEDSKPISNVLVYLIVPAAMINAFQIDYTPEIRDGFLLSLWVGIVIQVGILIFVRLLKKPLRLTGVEMSSIMYSNAGNLVIPLITAAMGEEWVIYTSTYCAFQMILIWNYGNILIEEKPKVQWKKIFTNPSVIAIFLGVILFLTRIKLPPLIGSTVSAFSACLGPVSMIMLGMLLASVEVKKVFSSARIYLIIALKMVVLPALVLIVLKFTPLYTLHPDGKTILLITLLATITPSATTVVQIAQFHDKTPAYASAINMATTVVALLTMPLMIFLYSL